MKSERGSATAKRRTDARYRKLYPRIWRHKDFMPLDGDNKTLALYILTGPQTNRAGLFVFSPATASEDLGIVLPTLKKRLTHVCVTFGWRFDPTSRTMLVPSWWEWNIPENANVLTGALKDVQEVPSTPLYQEWANVTRKVCERLGVTFRERSGNVPETFGERSPIQEQVQEQYQRLRTAAAPPPTFPQAVENSEGSDPPDDELAEPDPPEPTPTTMPHAPSPKPGPRAASTWTPAASAGTIRGSFAIVSQLVRHVLAEGADWSYPAGEADLMDACKSACAKHGLAYDTAIVRKALDSERHKARTRRPT